MIWNKYPIKLSQLKLDKQSNNNNKQSPPDESLFGARISRTCETSDNGSSQIRSNMWQLKMPIDKSRKSISSSAKTNNTNDQNSNSGNNGNNSNNSNVDDSKNKDNNNAGDNIENVEKAEYLLRLINFLENNTFAWHEDFSKKWRKKCIKSLMFVFFDMSLNDLDIKTKFEMFNKAVKQHYYSFNVFFRLSAMLLSSSGDAVFSSDSEDEDEKENENKEEEINSRSNAENRENNSSMSVYEFAACASAYDSVMFGGGGGFFGF